MTTRLRPLHAHLAHIPKPPLTSRTSPVMNAASSEQRKRTAPATSSGSPSRPSGVRSSIFARRVFRDHVGQLRLDVPGRDDVCTHAAAAELLRERLREADDPGLRGRVVRLAPVAVHADDRRDVHDRARPALHHPARHRAAGVEDRAEVRLEHGTPVVVAHPREHAVAREPGVVDEDRRCRPLPRRPAAASSGTETSPCTVRAPISPASSSASSRPLR